MAHHTFTYNDSFPQPPSADNIHYDQPWRTLFPTHGPYFNKSATEPERWTFAVFHQLHCVVSLLPEANRGPRKQVPDSDI
jgi:hypothetical protein